MSNRTLRMPVYLHCKQFRSAETAAVLVLVILLSVTAPTALTVAAVLTALTVVAAPTALTVLITNGERELMISDVSGGRNT